MAPAHSLLQEKTPSDREDAATSPAGAGEAQDGDHALFRLPRPSGEGGTRSVTDRVFSFPPLLPIAHCLLPIAHCPLPIAHCPLPSPSKTPSALRAPPPQARGRREAWSMMVWEIGAVYTARGDQGSGVDQAADSSAGASSLGTSVGQSVFSSSLIAASCSSKRKTHMVCAEICDGGTK